MKHFILLLCLFLPTFLAAQCDYDQLFREGKAFQKQRLYKKALYKFNSARRCDPAKGETVDAAIEALLDQIEGEKRVADRERKRAEDALADAEKERKRAEGALADAEKERKRAEDALTEVKKQQDKNEKIINSFYFYADKYALAFKDGKYGFINKEGTAVIDYDYDEATPFDRMGYAQVKKIAKNKNSNDVNESKYLIDTTGNVYPLATDSIAIDTNNTEALDLSYKKLRKDYANIYKSKKLKILTLSNNDLYSLSPKIGELTDLQIIDLSYNKLESLPLEIQKLEKLQWLILNNNAISDKYLGKLRAAMPWCRIECFNNIPTISKPTRGKGLPPRTSRVH